MLKLRTTDQGAPVLRNMILSLDGLEYRGTVLDTVVETQTADGTIQQNATTARFFKLGLVPRLFHTVASVPVAYLLFVIGLSLLVFEFFTAGVGVAGVVGVVCMVLCYGLGVLPVRGWALAALILSMVCFAVDVQVGVPRFWTAVGLLLFTSARSRSTATACRSRGSRCSSALAASRSRSWSACRRWSAPGSPPPRSVAKACSASTASPSPTSDPRVSCVRDAKWRARTNRATPIGAGDRVRVVAIDGITLEVEPEQGAAARLPHRRVKTPEG